MARNRPLAVEPLESRWMLSAGPLVITEIMYHPSNPTAAEAAAGQTNDRDDFEFVEFQNVGTEALPLAGISMTDGVQFTFGDMTLESGGHIVIVKKQLAFEARYGTGIRIAGTYQKNLDSSGEKLVLKDAAGQDLLNFTYNNAWYSETDGNGSSLDIVNPLAAPSTWNTKSSWQPSFEYGGSPGRANQLADLTPPSIPQNLHATVVGTRVNLQWDAAVDAESGVTEYRVYRDGTLLGSSTAPALSDSSVELVMDYVYRVMAVNGQGGESAKSDPLTVFVPPMGTDPTFANGVAKGSATNSHITEASGLVASRTNADVLWTHNDGSKPAALYAIDSHGSFLGTFLLAGIQAIDCEDVAIGPGPVAGVSYLYLGDIGDNTDARSTIQVYRVAEPTVLSTGGDQSQTLSNVDILTLSYPDGAHDAETLLSDPWTGDLLVISKTQTPNRIYRAAAASLMSGNTIPMSLMGTVDFSDVSAGDISSTGSEILLRREDFAELFVRSPGQSVAQALATTPFQVPVIGTPTEPNGEAIGFSATGRGYFTLSEGLNQPLYYFRRTSIAPGLARVTPVSGLATTEAGSTATFSIVLVAKPTADVTIGLATSDTTEGTVSVASLTFTPGNWNQPRVVTVTGVDDVAVDGDVAYTVVTAAAVSTDPAYSGMDVADVSVTNRDSTRSWVGGAGSEWTTPSNWIPSVVPQSGDCLIFDGSAAAQTVNHFPAGTTFRKLIFENGDFVVSGNGIVVPAGGMTISVAAGATCRLDIPLTGSGGLYQVGEGQLTLHSPNGYAKATTVSSGTLVVGNANAIPPGGSLTIGSAGAVVLASGLTQAIQLSGLSFEVGLPASSSAAATYAASPTVSEEPATEPIPVVEQVAVPVEAAALMSPVLFTQQSGATAGLSSSVAPLAFGTLLDKPGTMLAWSVAPVSSSTRDSIMEQPTGIVQNMVGESVGWAERSESHQNSEKSQLVGLADHASHGALGPPYKIVATKSTFGPAMRKENREDPKERKHETAPAALPIPRSSDDLRWIAATYAMWQQKPKEPSPLDQILAATVDWRTL